VARELQIRQLTGTSKDRELTVREFPLLIGRAEECHLRFDPQDETKVSALHAEIRLELDGTFLLHDLDSRNGTYLNGARMQGPSPLPEHSILEVGQGGPQVDLIVREGGSGVSFKDIRRKTGSYKDPQANRPMVATDDSLPAYQDTDLKRVARVSDRLTPKPQTAMFLMIAIVTAILVAALVYLA
jgi:pSer/pThr/pTyr-binding forkhead associated (FHA) protein